MPHAHTLRLLEAWGRSRPGGGAPPARTALTPIVLGPLTPQISVLAEAADGSWRFRTAGALVEDLHACALAGAEAAALWADGDRARVRRELAEARRRGRPWTAVSRGETPRGRTALLELTLAPVTGVAGAPDRLLMLHQPLTPLVRLAGEALDGLRLCAPPAVGGPRLVVDNGRARPPVG